MEQSYKEKYEQALAKAKEQYNYPCMRSCMGILEEIFPELAESEDEKIRKEIVRFIQMEVEDEIVGNKWLAWLGKQKGNIGGISPNWSEEDKQYVEDTLALIGFGFSAHTIGEVQEWLHSLQDRVQPKQEWSEDDKKIINSLIDSLTRISLNTRTDSTSPNFSFYKEIDWLKSLKPQNRWKPSDEQICLLQAIINEPNNAASESCQIVLKDILEQLKKLKEE